MNNPNRPLEIAAFLDQSGWGRAEPQALDGDFSTRRYARLTATDGNTAILMDADAGQNTPRFVAVAAMLRQVGIAAPEIYQDGSDRDLLLLQDFGARNVGALIDNGGAPELFYMRAAELLAKLHGNLDISSIADLPLYNAALFTEQATLFLDAYIPFVLRREATDEEREDFRAAWQQMVLRPLDAMPKCLMLRDFMPDNLMDLPQGRLGVLDFQDAGIGPVAYDLASLCEEVRRDGGFDLLPDVIAHYREKAASKLSQNDLVCACTILSAQRHTRILGIIARLAAQGRQEKLTLLPRIRKHLTSILQEPHLMPVRAWMERMNVL